ncbi:DUF6783 domain-containing protein [Ruminococcus sp. J1101004sp1_RTP21198st1_B9_RTP21198_201120]
MHAPLCGIFHPNSVGAVG